MSFGWITWSNPVAIWWTFLFAVSALNIALFIGLHCCYRNNVFGGSPRAFAIEPLMLLCAIYVFGCAFRSVLPRADVQRICLFDTWLSSVMVGRSVATVPGRCFAAPWGV